MTCLKQIFLGTTKFEGHTKFGGAAPKCPPWLRACTGGAVVLVPYLQLVTLLYMDDVIFKFSVKVAPSFC